MSDNFKTREKYDVIVSGDSYLLQYVSGWFGMQELVNKWHDDKICVGADINCFVQKMWNRAVVRDPWQLGDVGQISVVSFKRCEIEQLWEIHGN